jgi:hypothetical protein
MRLLEPRQPGSKLIKYYRTEEGEMRKLRPRPSPSFFVLSAILVAMMVALTVLDPHQIVWWLVVLPLGVGVVGWFRLRSVRLEISESVVRATQGWYLPERQVARSQISAIHYFPRTISFRGPDQKPIMKIAPGWTMRQMLEVADLLGVPLYDHRRWLGLRSATMGRLANPKDAVNQSSAARD